MRRHTLKILGIVVLALIASSWSKTTKWEDIAAIGDGSTVLVERSVKNSFTAGELSQSATRWPSYYQLRTTNPKNGHIVKWKGTFGIKPVLIGFTPHKTYLVTLAVHCDAKIERFSIQGFPYVFQESTNGSTWVTVAPKSFPGDIRSANLSGEARGNGTTQKPKDINRTNRAIQFATSGHYSYEVPRSFNEWNYPNKNEPLCPGTSFH